MVLRETVKGSFWLYLGSTLSMLLGLIGILILPRLLDVANWGIFAATIAITSFFASLFDAGLGYTIVHQTSMLAEKKKYSTLRGILATLLKYKLLIVIACALLIFAFADSFAAFFKAPGAGIYFRLSAAFFILFNVFGTLDGILVGLKWFKESAIASFSNYLLRLVLSVALVIFGFGISGAIIGYTAAVAFTTALQIFFLKGFLTFKSQPLPASAWAAGLFVGISSVAWAITVWTDSLMLGFFIGASAVGIYKIAMSIAGAATGLIGTFNRAIFPIFAAAEAKKRLSGKELGKIVYLCSLFGIPATVGLATISRELISTFYSSQYIDAAIPLTILSYLIFDAVIVGPISLFLAAKGKTKFIGVLSTICAGLNVLLNAVLIPLFGFIGAAAASVLTRLCYFFEVLKKAKDMGAEIDFVKLVKPVAASAIMMLVLLFVLIPNLEFKLLRPDWTATEAIIPILVVLIGGVVIYFVAMLLLGVNLFHYISKGFETLRK